ncbi:hypothetical protein KJ815_05830 [bacterium]|nr:hypothetical protein [bacterium]
MGLHVAGILSTIFFARTVMKVAIDAMRPLRASCAGTMRMIVAKWRSDCGCQVRFSGGFEGGVQS